jgi:hypothetical protein
MNTEHTAGPWTVSKPSGNYIDAPASKGSIAALTFSATPADARLIAAAPELLAALEDLVKANYGQPYGVTVPALDNARAVIAKARP